MLIGEKGLKSNGVLVHGLGVYVYEGGGLDVMRDSTACCDG